MGCWGSDPIAATLVMNKEMTTSVHGDCCNPTMTVADSWCHMELPDEVEFRNMKMMVTDVASKVMFDWLDDARHADGGGADI